MALTMDELVQAVYLGSKYVAEELSLSEVLQLSYEAESIYPSLIGYALGSIATLFSSRNKSWLSRLAPAGLCLMLLLYTLYGLQQKALKWLLILATITGVCCTYVQLASLSIIREHFQLKKISKHKKRD